MIALALLATAAAAAAPTNLVTVEQISAAVAAGPNRKVGFLSLANYQTVQTFLPASVENGGVLEVVVCDGQAHYGVTCTSVSELSEMVVSGVLAAALISGLPETRFASELNLVPSGIVSPQVMLMRPDASLDLPHGATSAGTSSAGLGGALDAALMAMQLKGTVRTLVANNQPFHYQYVHSCAPAGSATLAVPNKSEATGVLADVLATRQLKIGALGPNNWGSDGNYIDADPTVVRTYSDGQFRGFYPDALEAICREFNALAGPDGVRYDSAGPIVCTRVWRTSSVAIARDLFDGATHASEPYYLLDALYTGTQEACETDADCRPAATASGRETCTAVGATKVCKHTPVPRKSVFRASCTLGGTSPSFLTKYTAAPSPGGSKDENGSSTKLSTGAVAGIAAAAAVAGVALVALVVLTVRERMGSPVFRPLLKVQPTSSASSVAA
eukprot:TRINITY_DN4271_c0_g1_i1.p3 TRINITY_DN4271_c0_g1~~TRINITY_DN4271_c0_g1_i1.p3  ORF type:complete len:444 (+),score=117.01 TRINITY_DN4271_c0_g1_i1:1723-3054(+)